MKFRAFLLRGWACVAQLAVAAALIVLAMSCAPIEYPVRRCVKSHSETKVAYWPTSGGAGSLGIGITPYGVGIHAGSGIHLVQETVCDEYGWFDSTGVRVR